MTQERLSDEQVNRAWARVHERTKQLQEARASQVWEVSAGSPLAGDDRVSNPWYTSHAAANALSAAVDHLHALSVLVGEARVLHTNADFTLARGCLENAAIALWVVEPKRRAERVERGLRWYATDARDGNEALADLGSVSSPRPLDERLADFRHAAERAGSKPDRATERMRSTGILRAADASTPSALGALFPWRLCSAFAHGRPWASLGLLERETVRTVGGNVLHLRMTSSLDRVLYPAWAGLELVEFAVETYARRAASPS